MTYFKTSKGSHKHQSFECANQRRALGSSDPIELTNIEATELPACDFCCSPGEVLASVEKHLAEQATMCRNSGVAKPLRYQSTCRDCGKLGTVVRSTGTLRAHKK